MEYPIWQLGPLGGGFFIALVSVVHVYVAHFAVGGGLFLVLTEMRAARERSQVLLDYARRHTKFFLLLTMVFGGVTGVGIWFTIALIAPQATSSLIHLFVWGWAAEWVFFVLEIVALLVYHYSYERMERGTHILIGWIYFGAGLASLIIINGIVSFMLDTGDWPATQSFWSGFFNPGFWPSTVFRTLLSCLFAGLFGFVTATRIERDKERVAMVRTCARWAVVCFALSLAAGWWYIAALPEHAHAMVMLKTSRVALFVRVFLVAGAAVTAGSLLLACRLPQRVGRPAALAVLAMGLVVMGGYEFAREAGRKPWLIPGHTYSNSIKPGQLAGMAQNGALASARWTGVKSPEGDQSLAAGRELFELQCASCHSLGGPINDILPLTAHMPEAGVEATLTGLGRINTYMPPFAGTLAERKALASFISRGLHGRMDQAEAPFNPAESETEIPPYDRQDAQYVLLTWSTLGFRSVSDCDAAWSILPPGNALAAVLVKRGSPPEIVTENVEISYAAPGNQQDPASQVDYWRFSASLAGRELPVNVSAKGKGMAGTFDLPEGQSHFLADGIPVVPYDDKGGISPYPLFEITAREKSGGRVLARTKAVVPVAAEMGCRNCHGGPWRKEGATGISRETALNILSVHDRSNGTDLKARAEAGKPVLCQSCHPDDLLKSAGKPGLLNMSAAIHGLHANSMTGRAEDACASCHPDKADGPTRCLRGFHGTIGLTCVRCHGTLEDHALSLLKSEQAEGKKRSGLFMANLKPRLVQDLAQINARKAWVQEPDCLGCHKEFQRPDYTEASAFNAWTADAAGLYRNRKDDMDAVRCAACHNSPHAEYPALNPYGDDRDNVQPLQYQGVPTTMGSQGNCTVCHTEAKDVPAHHPSMLR